jgi:hypothetical protein
MLKLAAAELVLSGSANIALGVYLILLGSPLGVFLGFGAIGIGAIAVLTVADLPKLFSRSPR